MKVVSDLLEYSLFMMKTLSTLLLCAIFTVTIAARAVDFEFKPNTYFLGSWLMEEEHIITSVDEERGLKYYINLNVTAIDEENLEFKYFNNKTGEINEFKSFVSTGTTDKMLVLPPFFHSGEQTTIEFQPLIRNSSYVIIHNIYNIGWCIL